MILLLLGLYIFQRVNESQRAYAEKSDKHLYQDFNLEEIPEVEVSNKEHMQEEQIESKLSDMEEYFKILEEKKANRAPIIFSSNNDINKLQKANESFWNDQEKYFAREKTKYIITELNDWYALETYSRGWSTEDIQYLLPERFEVIEVQKYMNQFLQLHKVDFGYSEDYKLTAMEESEYLFTKDMTKVIVLLNLIVKFEKDNPYRGIKANDHYKATVAIHIDKNMGRWRFKQEKLIEVVPLN